MYINNTYIHVYKINHIFCIHIIRLFIHALYNKVNTQATIETSIDPQYNYITFNESFVIYSLLYNNITKQMQVLSSFMIYHCICNMSNMTGAISGAQTAYRYGAPEFTPSF